MKKQILSFLFVLSAALLISTSAFAVGNAAPSPGQTATYGVTTGLSSYEWKVLQSDGITPAIVTEYQWTPGTLATQDIKWLASAAGKSYKVWVQGTDATGCKTDPKMFDVTVSSPIICIATDAGPAGSVVTAGPNNQNQCSLLTTGITGYNGSGTYGDQTTFFATISGGIPSLVTGSAYTVTYTVSSTAGASDVVTTSADLITNASGAGALSITVKATDHVTHFTAVTANTVTITLNKVTYNGVDVTNTCAGNSYPVTVKALPVITF